MPIYLGQWEWNGQGEWQAPGGNATGLFDYRSIPQQSLQGGPPQGYGLFVYASPQSHPLLLRNLGTDPARLLSPVDASAINTLLGTSLVRDVLYRVVRQSLFDLTAADPSGLTRWKPLRGSLGRRIQFGFARAFGAPWVDEVFREGHPAHAATLAVFREDYARNRDAAGSITPALRRWTGATMNRLYGRMEDALARDILPDPYKGDGWLPPASSFTETWPTNKSPLDSPSTGQDQTWVSDENTANVVGNHLEPATLSAQSTLRCTTSLSTDDHWHQATATIVDNNARCDVGVRKIASSTLTYYMTRASRNNPSYLRVLFKIFAAAPTILQVDTVDPGSPVLVKTEAVDSTIKSFFGGIELFSQPDTAITGNLLVEAAVRAVNTLGNSQLDGHLAADKVVAAALKGHGMLLDGIRNRALQRV